MRNWEAITWSHASDAWSVLETQDVEDASHKMRFIHKIVSSKEIEMVQEEKIDKES